ncbi:MAG: dockerin type I repeat-containing protein, partial [Oscillospiraceae bacterium]|nr:dockerin type I repeat-containing protein [Oscillospiraceae bacterium]
PSTLHVSELSEPKTGLNLLNTLENSNEPNKTWSGKANYFSPFEMAAMCSADYDGHEGTIPNAGVKTADPNFKLAIGGMLNTASLLEYLDEMKLWFSYHRTDKKFAVDVLNVHMGAETYNPEDSAFTERVKQIQNWIDENAPDTELWISEFEVPMGDCETENLDNHDNDLYQLRYAQRVARTYLMSIGAGVDRMTKFQLRDEGEGVYYNSGLTTGKGEWSKKLAWYYTAGMTSMLKNADFIKDNSTDTVKDYIFKDRKTGDEIHCLWSPTSEDKVIKNYSLNARNFGYAYLTELGTYAEGVTSELNLNKQKVSVNVSESPVFVKFSGSAQTVVNGKGKYIVPASLEVTAENKPEQFERMFDEPDSMPEFIYSDTGSLKTPETNVNASNITGIVKLDKKYILTGFGVYDTYGTGSLEIYDANTDTLLWSSDLGSYMSRSISLTADSLPTDTLKIVKGGGDFNELAFFGYPAPETSSVAMDVTNDGKFNTADVIALQKWLLSKKSVANPAESDTNHDGIVNIYDWIFMKKALLKK